MPRPRKTNGWDRDGLVPSPPRHSPISRPTTRNAYSLHASNSSIPSILVPSSSQTSSNKRKRPHGDSTLTASLVRERSWAPITTVKFCATGRYRSRLQRILTTAPLSATGSLAEETQEISEPGRNTMKESALTPVSARKSTPYPSTATGQASSTVICGSPKAQHPGAMLDDNEDSDDSDPPRRLGRSRPWGMPPRKIAAVETSPSPGPPGSPALLPARINGGESSPGFLKKTPSRTTMDDLRRLKGVSSRVNNGGITLGPMNPILNPPTNSAQCPGPLSMSCNDKPRDKSSETGAKKSPEAVIPPVLVKPIDASEEGRTRAAATPDLGNLAPVSGQKPSSPSPHAHPVQLPLPQAPTEPQPQLQSSPQVPLAMQVSDGGGPITDQERIAHLTALCKQELDGNVRLREQRDAAQRRVRELEADKARLEQEVGCLAKYRAFVEQTKNNMDGL